MKIEHYAILIMFLLKITKKNRQKLKNLGQKRIEMKFGPKKMSADSANTSAYTCASATRSTRFHRIPAECASVQHARNFKNGFFVSNLSKLVLKFKFKAKLKTNDEKCNKNE